MKVAADAKILLTAVKLWEHNFYEILEIVTDENTSDRCEIIQLHMYLYYICECCCCKLSTCQL